MTAPSVVSTPLHAPEHAPRITPGNYREIGAFAWIMSKVSAVASGTETLNLFSTMGRHPKLFRGWLRFAGRLMPGGILPRRETELVILRVAHLRGCAYEFEHHVRMSRRSGVTRADVDRLVEGPEATGWTDRESAILCGADAVVRDHDVDDDVWRQLRRHLDEREVIEVILLAGHYDMLATFVKVLRIDLDQRRQSVMPFRRRAARREVL